MGQITFKTGTITFKGGTVTFKSEGPVATPTVFDTYWTPTPGTLYFTVRNNDSLSARIWTRVQGGSWVDREIRASGFELEINMAFPDPGFYPYEIIVDAYASISGRTDSGIGTDSYTITE